MGEESSFEWMRDSNGVEEKNQSSLTTPAPHQCTQSFDDSYYYHDASSVVESHFLWYSENM